MKTKKILTWVALAVFGITAVFASISMARMDRTYDGQNASVSVYELQQNPAAYDDSSADGAAAAIVQQNLEESHSVNDVTSIVFDFRGYDTMGEAFILITAVAGSIVILHKKKDKKKEEEDKDE